MQLILIAFLIMFDYIETMTEYALLDRMGYDRIIPINELESLYIGIMATPSLPRGARLQLGMMKHMNLCKSTIRLSEFIILIDNLPITTINFTDSSRYFGKYHNDDYNTVERLRKIVDFVIELNANGESIPKEISNSYDTSNMKRIKRCTEESFLDRILEL